MKALCVGKSRELIQIVAQAGQVAKDGVMFLYDVLRDLCIDGCFPYIFGQCTESCLSRPMTDDIIL